MSDSRDSQNQDKKVYEVINQYYYDIESSKIYFGTFKVWKLREDKLLTYLALVFYFLLAALSILIIFLNALNLLRENTYIHTYVSGYMVWIVYVSSLLIYAGYCLYIENKKLDILKEKYEKDSLSDIQSAWIKANLPFNINKRKLIDRMVDWENTHKILKLYSNEFQATGKLFQSAHFNTVFKILLSTLPIVLSVIFLNGISIKEFSTQNPTTYLTIIIYLGVIIVILGFTYSSLMPLFQRFLCHIDGNKSKGAYRFNIFNRMLLHHVTIKELEES